MSLALFPLDIISKTILQLIPRFPYMMMDGLLMLFPTFGYFDQIRLMILKNNPNIYALNLCLILISQGLIKITFFMDEPFPIVLFGQGVGLCFVAFLHTFLRFRLLEKNPTSEIPHFGNNASIFSQIFETITKNPKKAMNIFSALTFLEFFTSVLFYYLIFFIFYIITRIICGIHTAVNISSIIANLIDALVPLPVFSLVVIHSNIESVSIVLIIQYVFGDMFKIFLCYVTHSPWPFIFGSTLQLILDSIAGAKYTYLSIRNGSSATTKSEANSTEDSEED